MFVQLENIAFIEVHLLILSNASAIIELVPHPWTSRNHLFLSLLFFVQEKSMIFSKF